jgi:hypothetical protein
LVPKCCRKWWPPLPSWPINFNLGPYSETCTSLLCRNLLGIEKQCVQVCLQHYEMLFFDLNFTFKKKLLLLLLKWKCNIWEQML